MKIMYLVDFGFDSSNGSNHLLLAMITEFLNEGHEVYLIQSRNGGPYPSIPKSLEGRKGFYCDIIERKAVRRNSFVKRYLYGIKFELDAMKNWKKRIKEMDIVVNHSHFTSPFTSLFLKKYRKNVVFNIYDIFPGEAYTNGNIKSKFVYDCLFWLQKIIYRNSKKIFTLTADTKFTLCSLGIPEEKLAIIPNWFDETRIHEIEKNHNTFMTEFRMDEEKKYIQYAGTLGVSYDFDMLLDVAKKLESREDIVFQVVGEGLNLERMRLRVEQEKIMNVEFVPWQPLERLSEVYSSCCLQIVPLRKDVIMNSYPSKILPLMACGRVAVISVEEESFFYKEINEKRIGLATPLGNVDKMAEGILELVDNDEKRALFQENAKSYVYKKYSAKINTKKIIVEFEKLMEAKDE